MYDYSSGKESKVIFTRRQRYEKLRAQMDLEQSSFTSHWRELADYILPRRSRFEITDTNRGDRRTQKILDNTATLAVRTLGAGMTSGITSPVRPWFNLSLVNKNIEESPGVKEWLTETSNKMRSVFLKSNLYKELPSIYQDAGVFGTSALFVEKDKDSVVHFHSFPIGPYKLSIDHKGRVNKFQRDFQMTVEQIVEKYGRNPEKPDVIDWSNISNKVKSLYYANNTEAWVQVSHIVEKNPRYNPDRLESKYKKYSSVYYERGSTQLNSGGGTGLSEIEDKFLSDKGYDYFPVLAPRWFTNSQDVYGTNCPGMTALGDIKQLQIGERRALQAVEKMINPPMTAPTSLRNQKTSILPGDVTFQDVQSNQQGFQPAHEVNFNLQALELKQQQVRERIEKSFYVDLFLMLSNSDRRQITATEIQERHEEKLLALGPVLEQLNQDLLDPLIEITFKLMEEQDLIPEPPDELRDQDLKIEYTSVMAQAQKLVGISAINNFTQFVGGIAQFNPEVLDKIDMDKLVDTYGDAVSVPTGIIRDEDQVAQIREQRAQQQQQMAQQEQALQAAQTAKTLSETPTDGDTALQSLQNEVLGG